MPDWIAISRRNARSVQTTVGWIFWDPGAIDAYRAAGLPAELAGPLGYVAARCAPLAAAGPEAVKAAFGSISPLAIDAVFDLLGPDEFAEVWAARDRAITTGLRRFAPGILGPLTSFGPLLWPVVDALPLVGRVFFGAHLAMDRPAEPVLSGWHAVNCLREWRGDTHWSLVVAAGLSPAEVSILHNSWLGYEGDWLAISRGMPPDEISAGWDALVAKGLASGRTVSMEGISLRARIENETDRLTTDPWELLGEPAAIRFAEVFEPPCALLLSRVDDTAGPQYQPASRVRPSRSGPAAGTL